MPVDIGFVTGIVVIGIIIIAVIGNVLTLFVIIRYDPLRDVTGMFLANLAVADLLQSIFGMPLVAASAFSNQWIFGEALCTISGLTNSLFCIASVLTLTTVSVDRWLAIVYPLKYQAWLTITKARIVLAYIWLHALVMAFLPVLGWSRYVYLSYEFICTVQWEYDKPYTIFLSVTSFVTPLIVTVICYTSVMRVARRQAREKPPITIGRFSASEQDNSIAPDVRTAQVNDGKKEKKCRNCGKENRAFVSDPENNIVCPRLSHVPLTELFGRAKSQRDKLGYREDPFSKERSESTYVREDPFSQEISESTVVKLKEQDNSAVHGPSKVVKIFDQKIDPDHPEHIPGNPVVVETGQDQTFQHPGRTNEGAEKPSVNPVGSVGMIHLNPVVIVVSRGSSKISPENGKHRAVTNVNPSGRIGKSRVSPVAFASPVPAVNRWTEEIPQRRVLTIINEEDEKNNSRKNSSPKHPRCNRLPGHLSRMCEWVADRTEDSRIAERKKEMKVALILLVVNGTFILCWLPHFIGITCLTFTNGSCPFPDSFFTITTTLAMLNSGCNPFIYTLSYRKFRKAFKKVLPCFRSNRTGNMETTVD